MDEPTQATQSQTWTDGQGRSWQIDADPELVILSRDGDSDERVEIPQSDWRRAISFAPSGTRVVIHFDTGMQEIGFLVPMDEARSLFAAMKQPAPILLPSVAPQKAVEHARQSTRSTGSPLWPKMTAMPIVAISLATISFIPLAGFLFGAVAIGLAIRIRQTSPDNPANQHMRTIASISLYVASVGLMIAAVATYAMFHHRPASRTIDPEVFRDLDWSLGAGIAAIVMIIMALCLHEAAHAITAWWCGDGYAKSLGRVTLNPLSHIDPFGTILLPIILVSAGLPVFGYARAVPVQLASVPNYRRAQILVAGAGPFSNILQAACCLAIITLISAVLSLIPGVEVFHLCDVQPYVDIRGIAGAKVIGAMALMLKLGFAINLFLAFFNMIPLPPLDGSWIAEQMLPGSMGRFYSAIRPYGMFIFLAMIYGAPEIIDYFLTPAIQIIIWARELIYLVSGF
ncbi:MAG TPA: site-2 protease family protein [Phycisphaerae bacterium]|nr:site-2 protease family protein [Phycisphaerae bacterium]